MKKPRNYVPCRVCGATHTNPASSSLCESEECVAITRGYSLKVKDYGTKVQFNKPIKTVKFFNVKDALIVVVMLLGFIGVAVLGEILL